MYIWFNNLPLRFVSKTRCWKLSRKSKNRLNKAHWCQGGRKVSLCFLIFISNRIILGGIPYCTCLGVGHMCWFLYYLMFLYLMKIRSKTLLTLKTDYMYMLFNREFQRFVSFGCLFKYCIWENEKRLRVELNRSNYSTCIICYHFLYMVTNQSHHIYASSQ